MSSKIDDDVGNCRAEIEALNVRFEQYSNVDAEDKFQAIRGDFIANFDEYQKQFEAKMFNIVAESKKDVHNGASAGSDGCQQGANGTTNGGDIIPGENPGDT